MFARMHTDNALQSVGYRNWVVTDTYWTVSNFFAVPMVTIYLIHVEATIAAIERALNDPKGTDHVTCHGVGDLWRDLETMTSPEWEARITHQAWVRARAFLDDPEVKRIIAEHFAKFPGELT